ncbi:hypothetical protein C8A03DRAFT_38488, partial [Achaetomium macrosporum]
MRTNCVRPSRLGASSRSSRRGLLPPTIQQQSRFYAVDQESVNALLQDYLDSAIEEEVNEKPFVTPGTQAERDRIWTVWTG